MQVVNFIFCKTRETLEVYWVLVRIIVPVAIITEAMSRIGMMEAISPVLAPIMGIYGLPPELGLAWLTGMLVGLWGAVPLVFTLVPVSSMSIADITVFSALLLFAHGLPAEQKIIQKAGPGLTITLLLRVGGALAYAFLLHRLLAGTGWLSAPVNPTWIPMSTSTDWIEFFIGLLKAMLSMLFILVALYWGLEIMKLTGMLNLLMKALAPMLRFAGIEEEAAQFTAVGLFLGISYGGGLLIREGRSGMVSPRQVFVSCVFMGFAHSIIEDTLIVMALGADVGGVLIGRLIFTVGMTAAIAGIVPILPDRIFYTWAFRKVS